MLPDYVRYLFRVILNQNLPFYIRPNHFSYELICYRCKAVKVITPNNYKQLVLYMYIHALKHV